MSKPGVNVIHLGGAGGKVTGSCNLLEIEGNRNKYYGLVDCGIAQGADEVRNLVFPLDGKNLDFIIITHAHMDHMGAIPLLRNYQGRIYGTREAFTKGLELLMDAAMNYEWKAVGEIGLTQEIYWKIKKEYTEIISRPYYEKKEIYWELKEVLDEVESATLYTQEDVENIKKYFQPCFVNDDITIADEVKIRLVPNNHQDGAVSVEMYIGEGDDAVNILFSGDIGPEEPLLYHPMSDDKNPAIQYCYVEGTHGTEEPSQSLEESIKEYEHTVLKALKKKKVVITGVFSLERLQQILYVVNGMIDKYNLDVPIYLDSKLGAIQTAHYQQSYAVSKGKSPWFTSLGKNPFDTNELIICRKHTHHMQALQPGEPKIILTASVWGEGGRILDYFEKYIQDDKAVFIFPSWLRPDCNSNQLHLAKQGELVSIRERQFVKHCQTVQIHGFTQHVYYSGLVRFLKRYESCKGIVVNHYDEGVGTKLQEKLSQDFGCKVVTAELYDNVESDTNLLRFTAQGMEALPYHEHVTLFKDVLQAR